MLPYLTDPSILKRLQTGSNPKLGLQYRKVHHHNIKILTLD